MPRALTAAPGRSLARRWAVALALAAILLCGLLVASPAGASVISPRAAHSPNADDIRTAYWVAIAVAALLVIAVHVFLIAAIMLGTSAVDFCPLYTLLHLDTRGRTPLPH